ncbi:MAG: CotH kinase family protein [Prevotella sp.]|nr:CotH kinase family protein [Prevotella sp.]
METPSITAGYPYLIKVTEAVSNPKFANVNFSTGTPSYYGNENVQLYASLITMAGWDLINNHNAYKLINGVLTKMAYYGEGTPEQSDILPPGGYVKTANNSVPSLSIEGSSGSGGGDDPIDPSSMTLQQKIAARMQLTDAPTVYITLPDIGNETLDSYLYKTGGNATTAADAPYRRASIKVVATDDTTSPHYMESFEEDADHLEIKVRGNSTALPTTVDAKRPYRLKFAKKDKTTGQNFKHDMTNAGYSKRNWVLLANAFDHSLIRNALTCELGKIVGMPFNPGYKFVDLVINGDYRGTYQISDHPEVDGDRINVDEDTGWYVEFQGRPDMCDYPMCISESGKITMNIKNPEPDDETDESQRNAIIEPIKSWFNDTWVKGFGIGFTNPTTGWRAYNDEDEWLKFLIITEITGDYDGMMSVKAYREVDGKLCLGPVWDKDLAYGNYGDFATTMVADIGNASSVNGYIKKLYSDPLFVKRLKDKMDELVNGGLSITLCSKIDELAGVLTNTRAQNTEKWGVNENYNMEKIHGLANYEAYIQQLKDWLTARITFVQGQFNQLYTAANTAQEDGLTIDAGKTQSENGIGAELIDKIYNVTLANKSFVQNQWNTISLPFSVNEQTLKGIFGDNYELKELAGIYTNGTTLYFATPKDNAISAGMPYLIKPSKVVEASPIFNNVTLAYCQDWSNTHKAFGENVTFGNYSFCANLYLNNTTLTDNGTDILIGGNAITFNKPTKINTWDNNATLNGIDAYIRKANGAGDPTISFIPEVIAQRTQKSDVPTIYIDTKDNEVIQPSTDEFVPAAIQVFDKNNMIGGNFTETNTFMEIRGRNKTEWSDDAITKKSYRLKFAKDEKDDAGNVTTSHKHDLTGGGYTKRNWILVANAADESMVRNALADELGKAMGFEFTPNYQFVDLYINNDYKGTYMATDHVEADKEGDVTRRVPVDEKQGWLLDMVTADGIATGDIYVEGSDSYPYINIKNPEPGKKTGTEDEIKTRVKTFFDTLWNANNGTGFDKASFVNWYIATEILGNASALTGIYAYKENDAESLKFGPLWGNELAFGNSTAIDMSDLNTTNSYNGMVYQSGTSSAWKTKLQALWQQGWFKQAVKERWAALYNNGTNDLKSTMLTKFNDVKTAINKADQKPTEEQLNVISTYLGERFEYLNTKFAELTVINGPVVTIGAGGYSSFSWDGALDFSGTGVEVYVATSYVKGILQLEKVADGKIPAETGVILKGNEGEKIYPQTISESVSLTTDNKLLNTAKAAFNVPSENSYYALATLNGKTALYKIRSGVTIPQNKAYLCVESQQAPAAIFFGDIDGGTTGLNEISVNADSQHEAVYDLQGRRMKGNLAKGIYIKNGKKFIVK